MPKRSSKKQAARKREDTNQAAARIVRQTTGQQKPADEGKNPAAVALGRLGGQKGGPARAKSLSAARRKAIAKKAAQARWGKRKSK